MDWFAECKFMELRTNAASTQGIVNEDAFSGNGKVVTLLAFNTAQRKFPVGKNGKG
jgi:hypothetical protein